MNKDIRYREIIGILDEKGPMSAQALKSELYTSLSTIYRVLREMERLRLIIHRPDGTVSLPGEDSYIPAHYKKNVSMNTKSALAKRAAEMVPPGATIHFDASSTVSYMIDYLVGRKDITVTTTSFLVAELLIKAEIPAIFLGGKVLDRSQVTGGRIGDLILEHIKVDYMFFSPQSVDENGSIYDNVENSNRRKIILKSCKKVCLCDNKKMGRASIFYATSIQDTDYLITNAELPPGFPQPRIETIII